MLRLEPGLENIWSFFGWPIWDSLGSNRHSDTDQAETISQPSQRLSAAVAVRVASIARPLRAVRGQQADSESRAWVENSSQKEFRLCSIKDCIELLGTETALVGPHQALGHTVEKHVRGIGDQPETVGQ